MASPFRIFRKYMKTLLVFFGVMIMFVFVIGDSLTGYLGGSRGGRGDHVLDANATAVSWIGGSLTNRQLDELVFQRRIAKSFILGVWAAGERSAFEAGVQPRPLRVEPLFRPDSPETPQQGVERSVVQTHLFAQAARDAGMRVSDETIAQYLDLLGRGNVSRDEMRDMVSRLGQGRITIDYVFDALRDEMLSRNYIASHQFAFETVTPQQRWADWLTVNDRIVIEAAAFPVEQFLNDVPEPSESDLLTFFDTYKNNEPRPDVVGQMELPSRHPGFRIPRKIDVQYIQGNYDEYVAKVEGEITDEDIVKYYEENKDPLFIRADTDLIDQPSDDEADADEQGAQADDPASSEERPDTSSDDVAGETSDDTVDNEPAADEADAAVPSDEPTSTSEEAPATDDSDAADAPSDEDQSLRGTHSPFRLAAFLQEEDAEASGESTSAPADDAPPDSEAAATGEEASDGESSEDDKLLEFQPLEEVRDVIRRQLAERRAAETLNDRMSEVAGRLRAEYEDYLGRVFDAEAAEREAPAPPAALADLSPLAKEYGFEHGSTGPDSYLQLRETPVGKSGNIETRVTVAATMFADPDVELFEPIASVDINGNHYVALKTSDTPARTPELDEVRDEVVAAWKRTKAAERALEEAQEQAKKAEEDGIKLAEYFSANESVEIVRTDPFSQYTGGDVAMVGGELQQQPFRLSQPDGIIAAGPEFLARVFQLKEGEVAAVLNHDHSIAYVIRVIQHMSSPEELRGAYLSEASSWPGLGLMMSTHANAAARSLVSDVFLSVGLNWARPSDQMPQEQEDEAG